MMIRVHSDTQASLEHVRAHIGARSIAETVRLLAKVAEGELGRDEYEVRLPGEGVVTMWPAEAGVVARAKQRRSAGG